MSEAVLLICCVVIFFGALLYGLVRSSPLQTCGAVVVSIGLAGILAGGLLWSMGL